MGNVLKRYLANTNLHGPKYLVEDNRHWTERLFWLITCTLCWWGCVLMIKDSLDAYYNRPIAFTVDTTSVGRDFNFASITICVDSKTTPQRAISLLAKEKFGINVAAAVKWNWMVSKDFKLPSSSNDKLFSKLTSDDIVNLYETTKLKCSDFMTFCFWNSLKFNCCEEFSPLRTGVGECYTFNSLQTARNQSGTRTFKMIRNDGILFLDIGLTDFSVENMPNIKIYIHNKYEVPTFNTYTDKEIYITPNGVTVVYFDSYDVFNEPDVKFIPPERRKCRFSSEKDDSDVYERYSHDACMIRLQMQRMLELCGCVSHIFPYDPAMPVCNYTGLSCLRKEYNLLKNLDYTKDQCLPDCEGLLIFHSHERETTGVGSGFEISQGIHIEPLQIPRLRYRRYVKHSALDLAVAIGSTVSLFMGAGILSVVEILHWFLCRFKA